MRIHKNRMFCLLAAALFLFSTVQATLAGYRFAEDSVHEIDLGGIKAQIVEQYEQAISIYPGNMVEKVVNVKNTGNSDCIVRVKVEKVWGEIRGEDGKLVADDTYSTDNISIAYNTAYWVYDETDGYFYYMGVLKPGESTLAPLFEDFSIDADTGNEYKGLMADIVIKMECVQAASDGISLWDKTFVDLGVTYTPGMVEAAVTSVTFVGGDDAFVFDPDTTDLFAGFKNLFPGETRNQVIVVKNEFKGSKGAEIFLRAEDVSQSYSDPETLELVGKLLREYATILVTDEEGNVIYSGPVWGEPYADAANPDSMRYDISLGLFRAGESKQLNIQLMLDLEMGDEYQNLLGLIKWVWSTDGYSKVLEDADAKVTISGSKTWKHGANPVSERPKELVIYVKANGNIITTQTVTAADHWKWSFKLPKYDDQGEEIQYTIDEKPILGYTTAVNGADVTNTHETYEEVTVNGLKTWDHGSNTAKRPGSIVVQIKRGDEIIAGKRVTETDNWKWTFLLPKYDEDGQTAVYTVDEEVVQYYTLAKNDGNNLHNKFVSYDYAGDTGKAGSIPKTGDSTNLWLWASLMAVSLTAFVRFLVMSRNSKENK